MSTIIVSSHTEPKGFLDDFKMSSNNVCEFFKDFVGKKVELEPKNPCPDLKPMRADPKKGYSSKMF